MRGLCRIGCGCILEYESHKFSDDFEYLLPKDLDNKPHHCVLFTIVNKVAREGLEMQDMNVIYQAAKKKLDIRYEKFEQLIDSSIADSGYEILGPSEIWHMMGMLRYGRLYELIQGHQLEITNRTLPFLKYRQYLPSQDESIQLREKKDEFSLTKKNIKLKDDKSLLPNEMCNAIPVILPTDNGYQLEYLGFYYELMTKFEDAKKCYDLQYQFTEEPELLEKSDELEKKIKKRNKFQKSMDDLKLEDAQKEVKHAEVNLKKYVTELFSNDFREIYKRDSKLKESVQKIRNKQQDSMLQIKENSETDVMSLGNVLVILKKCRTKTLTKFDGSCKKCKREWKKRDEIFLEKYPKLILCTDETCFKKQGGLFKDVKRDFVDNVQTIINFRNNNAHLKEYESEKMFNHSFKHAYYSCKMTNDHIEEFLGKNPYI